MLACLGTVRGGFVEGRATVLQHLRTFAVPRREERVLALCGHGSTNATAAACITTTMDYTFSCCTLQYYLSALLFGER